jgi:peroxiredoxin Q/BCP
MKTTGLWRLAGTTLLMGFLLACSSNDCSKVNNASLKVGDEAPDFTLSDHTGRYQRLSDYRGQNVVLAFYPAAFTPV